MFMIRAISLFSGAGGMDVGFSNAGINTIIANEFDKHAAQTYRLNHPNTKMIEGDLEDNMSKIIAEKNIDLVFGGPPCQGFSVAGKMEPDDPRSKLIFKFCDVIEAVKPKAFVMENVKALGKLDKFKAVRLELYKRFKRMGYSYSKVVLNAKDFGVPQSRERVFFIGIPDHAAAIKLSDFDEFKKDAPTLKQAIQKLGKAGTKNNPKITKAKITLAAKPSLRKSPYAGMLFNGRGRPLNPSTWSSTLLASMGGGGTPIIDERQLYDDEIGWVEDYHKKIVTGEIQPQFGEAPEFLRRLTIDEAAILQSFPDNYQFSGPQSKVFSQLGNAVPCQLAYAIAACLKVALSSAASRTSEDLFAAE